MNLETNIPKFKGFTNPLTKDGMRALAIVMGAIVVIAAVVYVANFGKRIGTTIFSSKTREGVTVTPQPTVTPLIKAATSSASPSSTRKVWKPTGTPTPALKGVTVTTAPTR